MKKIKLRSNFLYTLLVAVLFIGCVDINPQEVKQIGKSRDEGIVVYEIYLNKKVRILEVDSCQYIAYDSSYGASIIHKQNCKFCLERSDK